MSAVAALAVASPAAVVAVSDLSARTEPPTQHRQFVQAAMITDLPNELMSALSQGLSQFGINLPPLPTSLLTGSGSSMPTTGLGMAPTTTPGLGTSPLTTPGLGTTSMTTPGVGLPSAPATLAPDALTNPALTPALTSPAGIPPLGTLPATPGGLTTPPTALTTSPTLDPALASPISNAVGLPAPGEVPIGLDPAAGTYPILGDPSLGMPASSGGSPGLLGDLSSMANQLGAGQAIDLLKGMVMPAIMSAVKPAGAPAADAAAAATSALPAAAPAVPAPGL